MGILESCWREECVPSAKTEEPDRSGACPFTFPRAHTESITISRFNTCLADGSRGRAHSLLTHRHSSLSLSRASWQCQWSAADGWPRADNQLISHDRRAHVITDVSTLVSLLVWLPPPLALLDARRLPRLLPLAPLNAPLLSRGLLRGLLASNALRGVGHLLERRLVLRGRLLAKQQANRVALVTRVVDKQLDVPLLRRGSWREGPSGPGTAKATPGGTSRGVNRTPSENSISNSTPLVVATS